MPSAGGSGHTRVSNLLVCCQNLGKEWRKGRINVLPWYRLVGVVSTSSETQGGKTGLPARVSGRHVVRG